MYAVLAKGVRIKQKYEVLRCTEETPLRNTYIVRDRGSGRNLILEEIIPQTDDPAGISEHHQHFREEATRLQAVKYPSLPAVLDFFIDEKNCYLIRENIEGRTLPSVLEKPDRPPADSQLRNWVGQICETLLYLHSLHPPVILGELDPKNIVITPVGKMRFSDYGYLRFFPERFRRQALFLMPASVFASPEYRAGEGVDEKSDVYVLGAVTYYIGTGRSPGKTPLEFTHATGASSEYAQQMEDMIRQALEEEREKRTSGIFIFKIGMQKSFHAILDVDVTELNFPEVQKGQVIRGTFTASNRGGGTLSGRIWGNAPWIQVSPSVFQSNEQVVEYSISTDYLKPEEDVRSAIVVSIKGQEKVIPISIRLVPKLALAIPDSLVFLFVTIFPVFCGILIYLFFSSLATTATAIAMKQLIEKEMLKEYSIEALKRMLTQDLLQQMDFRGLLAESRLFAFLSLLFAWLCPFFLYTFYSNLPRSQALRVWRLFFICLFIPSIVLVAIIALRHIEAVILEHPSLRFLNLFRIVPSFVAINAISAFYYSIGFFPRVQKYLEERLILRLLLPGILLGIFLLYCSVYLFFL